MKKFLKGAWRYYFSKASESNKASEIESKHEVWKFHWIQNSKEEIKRRKEEIKFDRTDEICKSCESKMKMLTTSNITQKTPNLVFHYFCSLNHFVSNNNCPVCNCSCQRVSSVTLNFIILRSVSKECIWTNCLRSFEFIKSFFVLFFISEFKITYICSKSAELIAFFPLSSSNHYYTNAFQSLSFPSVEFEFFDFTSDAMANGLASLLVSTRVVLFTTGALTGSGFVKESKKSSVSKLRSSFFA